jgi:hypothetical protein
VSTVLIVGLAWAAINAAYFIFQVGRTRGREAASAEVMEYLALLIPALEQLAQMAEALGDELGEQTKEQLDAIRKVAQWN